MPYTDIYLHNMCTNMYLQCQGPTHASQMCFTTELHSSSSQILFSTVNDLIDIKDITFLPKLSEQPEKGEGKIVRRTGRCSDIQQKDVSRHDKSVTSQTYCSYDYLHQTTRSWVLSSWVAEGPTQPYPHPKNYWQLVVVEGGGIIFLSCVTRVAGLYIEFQCSLDYLGDSSLACYDSKEIINE